MTDPQDSSAAPREGSAPDAAAKAGGVEVIRSYAKSLPGLPGVYRMIDAADDVLYVGKAKNLKKRVSSYVNQSRLTIRIRRMVAKTAAMEFVTTHTEAEALLLEANLIKRLAPRYNILLRDDKSFPLILLTSAHQFPRVLKHRGARSAEGEYFGPFASAGAVNQSLAVLQRAFLLRSCTDTVFAARQRPCLLYQIKRCSAPCVGRIGAEDYGQLAGQARAFLTGDSKKIQESFAAQMQKASDSLDFETAAEIRDRIRAMTSIQTHNGINAGSVDEADVIALHQTAGQTGIQVFFFRSGCNYGNRAYYPAHANDAEVGQILEAFVGQFYADKMPPRRILLSHGVPSLALLAEALSRKAERKVRVEIPQRGEKRLLVEHAVINAREALARRLAESASQRKLLEGLAEVFNLEAVPERIEVFDNSHVSGTNAVGGMIVAGPEGLVKKGYRKFNIRGAKEEDVPGEGAKIRPGDDYAMMREVLTRRFSRALKEIPDHGGADWPDLVIIDGGAGHLGLAREVFDELGITDVALAAIAKGAERNAGRERIFLPGREAFRLDSRDPVLYFLQRLRDEAHRFAIGAHRARRSRSIEKSPLDEIPGIGGARKKALLHHFGSARAVSQAGLADLEAVEGISGKMAKKIYGWFHADH